MAYDLASPWCDAGEETRWVFFSGKLQMSPKHAKWATKYPKLDKQVMKWFSQQRGQIFHL